ncbi:MAG TPA: dienelactone hydrolase family protein [Anaerolineales bacterium]|nr:dienelactone hydrolase family protein [Anaerolineales bacterium]HMX76001.1 dienelactone hydrolase family protein [Anaerolineales bacterium]HND93566.1 dienelactone hydrolase family protein [Anaerolineales bacterium]HNE70020.1 dienelactone hydrolase family protein [Anaerolineales bacterium]
MKNLKRILLGLLAVLAILILFLPLSIFVDSLFDGNRLDALVNTTIPGLNGGPDVRAYVAKPEGEGPFPTVIMIHEFYGLRESIVGKADFLAKEGYLVIAPDTFRGSTTSWIPRAIYQVINTKPEDVNTDLDSVYAWLETQSDVDAGRIAILGFCYGGRTSLVYSLHNSKLAATVIFYGSPETDPEVLKSLPGPVLGIFGGADQSISVEEVDQFDKALTTANIQHEITVYDGQPHAFVENVEGIQAGGAQGEAWAQMLAFLEKNLKNVTAQQNETSAVSYRAPFAWKYYAMLVYEHAFGSASHQH